MVPWLRGLALATVMLLALHFGFAAAQNPSSSQNPPTSKGTAGTPNTPGALSKPAASDKPRIDRPTGDYQHLWLTFAGEKGGGAPAKAFVGLRDGKSTTVWFLRGDIPGGVTVKGSYQLLHDAHALTVSENAVKGTITARQVTIWAPMSKYTDLTMTIDAKRTGDRVAGTWMTRSADGKASKGTLTGVLTSEKTIASQQAFDRTPAWPSYHGVFGTNRAEAGQAELVADLTRARPVWRSEERLLSGWGTGVDSRYPQRAAVGMVCGGSSSPIVANGRVYLFHFVPAGEADPKVLQKALEAFEKNFKRKPSPIEHDSLVAFASTQVDMVVTCLDACTGAVLWRVTFPRMSGNIQTHKWRGFNPTPTLVGPVLIANDYANNWVGLDADRGAILWTSQRGPKISGDQRRWGRSGRASWRSCRASAASRPKRSSPRPARSSGSSLAARRRMSSASLARNASCS